MKLPRRHVGHDAGLPVEIASAIGLGRGERLLNGARELDAGAWLVATNHRLGLLAPEGSPLWLRAWHEVDGASWDAESGVLRVSWVAAGDAERWRLGDERTFLQTVRERVQASVVLSEDLGLTGRRTGRAVIRQDLASRELLEQVILGRGAVPDDEVRLAAERALAWLREQVGMPS